MFKVLGIIAEICSNLKGGGYINQELFMLCPCSTDALKHGENMQA